ncbi:hypothetical protein [Spirosoma jeollabukense]
MEPSRVQAVLKRLTGAVRSVWRISAWVIVYALKARKKPALFLYSSDTFSYWIWRWRWNLSEHQWEVVKLKAYCPVCQTPLTEFSTAYGTVLICPLKGREHGGFSSDSDHSANVRQLIRQKVGKLYDLTKL